MELTAPRSSEALASGSNGLDDAAKIAPWLELHFATNESATLEEIKLERPADGFKAHLTRGGASNFEGKTGDFKWTTAVRGLALILVRHAANTNSKRTPTNLVGGENSLAAALDYAITKQPQWLKNLFGTTEPGGCYARKLIRRVNSERKRGGDVSLFIRDTTLLTSNIIVFEDNERLTTTDELQSLAERLLNNERQKDHDNAPRRVVSGESLRASCSGRWGRRGNTLAFIEINKSRAVEISGTLGEEYFEIWRKNRNMRTALNAVRTKFQDNFLGYPIRLTDHTDVSVLNEQGDARLSRNILLANCNFNSVEKVRDSIWLEYPANAISLAAFDQTDGSQLKWSFARNEPCLKDIEIIFPDPIAPLGTFALSIEYTVPKIFRYDAFWFSRIVPGTIRQSCSVHIDAAKPLRHCYTLSESQNGQVTEGFPSVLVKNSEALTTLHWEWEYPTAETLVKLFWAT